MAIEDSPEKALPVKEIYAWIVTHFPFFKTAPSGWKNSVRHNLSLNKSFVKIEKAPVSIIRFALMTPIQYNIHFLYRTWGKDLYGGSNRVNETINFNLYLVVRFILDQTI